MASLKMGDGDWHWFQPPSLQESKKCIGYTMIFIRIWMGYEWDIFSHGLRHALFPALLHHLRLWQLRSRDFHLGGRSQSRLPAARNDNQPATGRRYIAVAGGSEQIAAAWMVGEWKDHAILACDIVAYHWADRSANAELQTANENCAQNSFDFWMLVIWPSSTTRLKASQAWETAMDRCWKSVRNGPGGFVHSDIDFLGSKHVVTP